MVFYQYSSILSKRGLKPFLWFTLYVLLRQGAIERYIKISTSDLSRITGASQQSASRHLKLLEKQGLISRMIESDGSRIRINEEGRKALDDVYITLRHRLENPNEEVYEFSGIVFSGMYQGGYYIMQEGYRNQIIEKLGFDPFPGTLNVRLRESDIELRRRLDNLSGVNLEGFKSANRAFGGARCYPLIVNNEVEGALIIADRTSYDLSVLEVIAPIKLRDRFSLKDGDIIRLSIANPRRSFS